jgi:hypothetical protein
MAAGFICIESYTQSRFECSPTSASTRDFFTLSDRSEYSALADQVNSVGFDCPRPDVLAVLFHGLLGYLQRYPLNLILYIHPPYQLHPLYQI